MEKEYLNSVALSLLSGDRDKTFTVLYEIVHSVIGLRSKISNALMALGLYKAKFHSKNMEKYTADALELCTKSLEALNKIETSICNYVSPIFLNILTKKRREPIDKGKLEKYISGFKLALEVFSKIKEGRTVDERDINNVKDFLICLDKDIESTFREEEKLYYGYLRLVPAI